MLPMHDDPVRAGVQAGNNPRLGDMQPARQIRPFPEPKLADQETVGQAILRCHVWRAANHK
jgi:hypothetical protein